MSRDDLTAFLDRLEDDGDLRRITAEVDAEFEIAEITRRVRHEPSGGPVLVFENVRGHTVSVVTNLLAKRRRVERLLETDDFDGLAARVFGLVTPDVPQNWMEALKLVPRLSQLTNIPPRTTKTGDCQQVVKLGSDVDLRDLPIPRCWPTDAAPAITAGSILTRDPRTDVHDLDRFPLSLRDPRSLFLHGDTHRRVWQTFDAHRAAGSRMPVAIVLGGDGRLGLVARAPVPPGTDAYLLAGLLRRNPVEVVKGRTVPLEVPTNAEIVIEGFVDPHAEWEAAGPIAAETGFAGLREPLPVVQVTAVTHRANPLLPVHVPTAPPTADRWVDYAIERMLVPFVRLFVPEVVDLHFPPCGVFRNLLFVSIDKRFPGHAQRVMNAIWGLSPTMHAKTVIVLDRSVDVHDESAVWFHVGANVSPGRDVAFWDGPTSMDDHAAPVRGLGQRMGVDATTKLSAEGHSRTWPRLLASSDETRRLVEGRWSEYGLDR